MFCVVCCVGHSVLSILVDLTGGGLVCGGICDMCISFGFL